MLPAESMLLHQPCNANKGSPFYPGHTVNKNRPSVAQFSYCIYGLLQLIKAGEALGTVIRKLNP